MKGIYKARLDNPKAIKRIEAVKKLLKATGVDFTETLEEAEITIPKHTKYCNTKYCTYECKNPEHEPRESRICVIVTAVGKSRAPKPKRVKPIPTPEWKIPADWEWTDEDLAFFAETAKMPDPMKVTESA